MTTAVLSIGSNVGDRLAQLQSVLDGFGPRVRAVSSVYVTPPWGGVEQDEFYNATLLVADPAMRPIDWLRRGAQLEDAAGRVREIHWGPRTLDVDVIVCDDVVSDDPELTLPHPQAHRRAFVLVPWLEIDPDAVLSVNGTSTPVRRLLADLPADEVAGVHRRADLRLHTGQAR
jgi:2-amino-4-hydroxy-6-hydroxymethyldihydropteridine diphosphokinase